MADPVNALAPQMQVANALAQSPVRVDPYDFTARYNTKLSPQEEAQFIAWATKNKRIKDLYDYDLRGFWKSGADFADNGHGADTYKKPNHPTFSTQSRYHDPRMTPGGTWSQNADMQYMFTPSLYNLQNMPAADMRDYFNKFEPGVQLNIVGR